MKLIEKKTLIVKLNGILKKLTPKMDGNQIININETEINSEKSCAIENNTRQIIIKARGLANMRIAFAAGESNYFTLRKGNVFHLSNLNLVSSTLYYQVDRETEIEIVMIS
jgi:hypothetical protein